MEGSQDDEVLEFVEAGVSVSLTHSPLEIADVIASVKSPQAGAVVLFAGISHCHFQIVTPRSPLNNR